MTSEIKTYLAENPAPQSIDVLVADNNGILRGKQFPGSQLTKLFDKGVNFPLTILFEDAKGGTPSAVISPPFAGDPDWLFKPIAGSLRPVPWAKTPTAQVFMKPVDKDGSDNELDARTALASVVERMNGDGLFPVIALEGEFYLLDPSKNPPLPMAPQNGWPRFEGPQVYALEPLRDVQGFLDAIKSSSASQGIGLTSILCEYGEGQFELNLDHSDDPLGACLEYLMLKHAVRNVALASGQLASFMAKPLAEFAGSGCHIHVSVLDEKGHNIFGADETKLHHAVGGVIETMGQSLALFAPFANSYRRYLKGGWSPSSGNWGKNHRGVSVRIPMSGKPDRRLEHRLAGADANPYLLTAAVLAGIHHGISSRIDPGPACVEGEVESDGRELPIRWREALREIDGSEIFRDYLGNNFIDIFCRAKFAEEEGFHQEVSDRDYGWCLRTV